MSSVGKSDSKSSKSTSSSESKASSKPSTDSKSSSSKPSTGPKPVASSTSSAPKSTANSAWSGKSGFDGKPTATSVRPPGTGTPASAGTHLSGTTPLGTNTVMSKPPPPPSPGGFLDTFTQAVVDKATSIGNTVVDTANTVVDTAVDTITTVGNTIVDTAVDTAVTVGNVAVDTATAVGNYVNPPSVEMTPPLPSFTGTAPVQGNSLTGPEKEARGAIKIDPNVTPETAKQYDGMYIGSDGYAYPPDKFDVSEVPPFAPANPTSNPAETTYFVNGINTLPQGAVDGAKLLANRTGTNVVPIYNATEGDLADKSQTALDRIDQGGNAAAETLTQVLTEDLANGQKVNVIGYSQGSAIVARALGDVYEQLPPGEREQQMSNINMVGIGGAGKTFPPGPQYNFIVNKQDVVPNYLGVHPGNPVADATIGFLTAASPVLYLLNGGGPGWSAPGATIHVIDDPAEGGIVSPHLLETYCDHIPEK